MKKLLVLFAVVGMMAAVANANEGKEHHHGKKAHGKTAKKAKEATTPAEHTETPAAPAETK